jgi:hypothetical protein
MRDQGLGVRGQGQRDGGTEGRREWADGLCKALRRKTLRHLLRLRMDSFGDGSVWGLRSGALGLGRGLSGRYTLDYGDIGFELLRNLEGDHL